MNHLDLEAQAERVARRVPDRRGPEARSDDGHIAPELRSPVEEELGVDLAGVRVRTGVVGARVESLGGDALTQGDEIHFAPGRWQPWHPGSRELLRHELVHVAQQRAAPGALPARRGSLQLGGCGGDEHKKVMQKLRTGAPVNHDEAVAVMKAYGDMGGAERTSTVRDLYTYGAATPPLQNLLKALTAEERNDEYAEEIKDMLGRVQAYATVQTFANQTRAAASSATMAATQGRYMEAEARKRKTEEDRKKGLPPTPPTPEQLAQTHDENVQTQSGLKEQKDDWKALTDEQRDAWPAKAKAVVARIVAVAATKRPELGLKPSHINLDPAYIGKERVRRKFPVFALSGKPMTVGVEFIAAADKDPESVLGTVAHELFGHPNHGLETETFSWKLYRESTKSFAGYKEPDEKKLEYEKNVYAYPETEIYSEIREADATIGNKSASDSPSVDIPFLVRRIIDNYEPNVAKSLLRGLWERFRIDPRINTGVGIKIFKNAVNSQKETKVLLQ